MTFTPFAINVGGVDEITAEFAIDVQNVVTLALVSAPAEDVAAEAKFRNLKVGFGKCAQAHKKLT